MLESAGRWVKKRPLLIILVAASFALFLYQRSTSPPRNLRSLTSAVDGPFTAEHSIQNTQQQPCKCLIHTAHDSPYGTKHASKLLHRLNQHEFTVHPAALHMGIGFATTSRLLRFVHKLLNGEPVLVGAIGGSVTVGHGTEAGKSDYLHLIVKWLQDTFPSVNITSGNFARSGTPSNLMLGCGKKYGVSPDMDLVFIEYVLNDGLLEHEELHGPFNMDRQQMHRWEQLVRKYSAFPRYPALVHMAVPSAGMWSGLRRFYDTAEDQYNTVLQYYGAGSLSLRNVVFQMQRLNTSTTNGSALAEMWVHKDGIHPTEAGHHVMADLAIMMIKQAVLHVLHRGYSQMDEDLATAPLPRPIFPGNEAPPESTCIMIDDLPALIQESDQFVLSDDNRMKPGYIATTPGAHLTVKVNVTPGHTELLTIMHLQSYEHMGKATVECVSGCTCTPGIINGHTTMRWSQAIGSNVGNISATSDSCLLKFVVLNETDSGEHKFKLIGIIVGSMWSHGLKATWLQWAP